MFMFSALPAPDLAQSFALVIAGLCRATASHIVVDRGAGPLLIRIFIRLHRLAARLTSLVSQVQAGKLPPPGPGHSTGGASRRQPRLPERSGWLLRLVPGTAVYAGQVQTLLDDPQTAALLEAAPQAGRILRPLCRMLALPLPDYLRRPRPPSAPPPTGMATGMHSVDPAAGSSSPAPATPPFSAARVIRCPATTATGLPPHPD
jgi:hypothetical protein